jgi:hypothetical protein
MFGNSQECERDCSNCIFSSASFQEALEKIPLKDKKELMEAFELVPHLVSTESNPIIFSRCGNSAEVSYNSIHPSRQALAIILITLASLTLLFSQNRLLQDE